MEIVTNESKLWREILLVITTFKLLATHKLGKNAQKDLPKVFMGYMS